MKKLMQYIDELYFVYYYSIFDSTTINEMEHKIELFIFENYEKITKKKYVCLKFDKDISATQTLISSSFRKELEKHYPERLI